MAKQTAENNTKINQSPQSPQKDNFSTKISLSSGQIDRVLFCSLIFEEIYARDGDLIEVIERKLDVDKFTMKNRILIDVLRGCVENKDALEKDVKVAFRNLNYN